MLFLLLIVLLSGVALQLVLKVPAVQTFLVKRAASFLSSELNTRVEIESVDIRFFRTLRLNGIYIEDLQQDTMLFVKSLDAVIGEFDFRSKKLVVSEVTLAQPRIGIKFYRDPREYNLDFLIDYFSVPKKDTVSRSLWEWEISRFRLAGGSLTYRDYKDSVGDNGIDWEDIRLDSLNLDFDEIRPEGDTLRLEMVDLSFREKSGFRLAGMKGSVEICGQQISIEKLDLHTRVSNLTGDLVFGFDDFTAFNDFITDVRWKGTFRNSRLYFGDLSFFAPELRNLDRTIGLSGTFSGTVERFKGRNVALDYSGNTYFRGDISMNGLPDFYETYMEVRVKELSLNSRDLETIPSWPFDSLKTLNLPSEGERLGTILFTGNFSGFYNDFVAYGNIRTNLGYIRSDLNLKIGEKDKQTAYEGNIRLFDFDAGKLWALSPDIGKATLEASVKGSGFELKNIMAGIEGRVEALNIRGYTYRNITLNGNLANRLFSGELFVEDPHLDLDFTGSVDLRHTQPVFDFDATLAKADLQEIGLLSRKYKSTLSAEVHMDITGSRIDDVLGTMQVNDLYFSENGKEIRLSELILESGYDKRRYLKVDSDVGHAFIEGKYNFSGLNQTFHHFMANYVPVLMEQNSARPIDQDFSFRLELGDVAPITSVFYPDFEISAGTRLDAEVNSSLNKLDLNFTSDYFDFSGVRVEDIGLDGHTDGSALLFDCHVSQIDFSDSVKLNNLAIGGFTNRDTASVDLDFKGRDTSLARVSLGVFAGFSNSGKTTLRLDPRLIMFKGETWTLDTSNSISIDTTGIILSGVGFSSGDQRIVFDGCIGDRAGDILGLDLTRFNTSLLNDFLSTYDVNISGIADGDLAFSSILDRPVFDAQLAVSNLTWFRDTLGDAEFSAEWNSSGKRIDISGTVTHGGQKNIQLDGSYKFCDEEDELDFTARLQKTYVSTFSHYLEGLFSDVSGVASGEVRLSGSPSRPQLTGKIYLQKINLTVDYLRTRYNFSTEVDILPGRFVVRDLRLNDIKGNQAVMNGTVTHDHLRDFRFDLGFDARRMLVMNTTMQDNELFFGTAYASGSVKITGSPESLTMDIGLKSEKGTKISVPLSNPEEVTRSGFITFVNSREKLKSKEKIEIEPDLTGIYLNMDFEITPDASIFLVFDSKIGDVIEGNGSGNITMTVSPTEDFKMFGSYRIESGKYLFTMQNIINKPFYIEKGGVIRWTGDPYQAVVDINAVYKLRTGLYDLFQDSSLIKQVPVDLRLNLSDNLFNPNINFDIKVQNIDPNTENQIKRLINTEEEKYRQAVSLLVMRRFTAPSDVASRSSISSSNVVGVNAYEMLSNQLSNWASQISSQVNVGLNYRPGDAITSEELEVALSTSLFNDRVTIDGNVGVGNNAAGTNNQNTSSLVGDFNVEVKVSKDGRIRMKAFNRSNNYSLLNSINSPYTQGVGVFYRDEFNKFSDLTRRFRKWLGIKKEENQL